MNLITAAILIFVTIAIYILFVETYTVLFQLTGLTRTKAHFQVISLLTNCGFTTKESETITSSKTRRKIALATMLTGNIFSILIVSLLINLFFSVNPDTLKDSLIYLLIISIVFFIIVILVRIPSFNRFFDNLITSAFKRAHRTKVENIIALIDNYDTNDICRIYINHLPEIFKETPLSETKLTTIHHISIMSIHRNSREIQVTKDVILQTGDQIIVYGDHTSIKKVFSGKAEKSDEVQEVKSNTFHIDNQEGENTIGTVALHILPKELSQKELQEIKLSEKYHINILYIKRGDDLISPSRHFVFLEEDEVGVFGPYQSIKKVFIDSLKM